MIQGIKAPGIRDRIKQQAVELIKAHPEGLRYSELFRKLRDGPPAFNAGTINSTIYNLDAVLPQSVWKPSKGLYRHTDYRDTAPADQSTSRTAAPQTKLREEHFYGPFADWLQNEAEEVTQAIPLGGKPVCLPGFKRCIPTSDRIRPLFSPGHSSSP